VVVVVLNVTASWETHFTGSRPLILHPRACIVWLCLAACGSHFVKWIIYLDDAGVFRRAEVVSRI
jgi:hypothetical protein